VILWTEPALRWKVLAAVFELMAVLSFVINRRRDRKAAGKLPQDPEPYANLQAAMARLREPEDKAAPLADSNSK